MRRQFWLKGVDEPLVLQALDSITAEHGSRWFEDTAYHLLRGLGFDVLRQVVVPDRGDGRRGRVDLVAYKETALIAIELDRCWPRKKSIFKVQQIKNATTQLVYCRCPISEDREKKFWRRKLMSTQSTIIK